MKPETEMDHRISLLIWDTSGDPIFRNIVLSYYRGAHSFMVVYDVSCRESFEALRGCIDDVRQYGTSWAVVMVVGNVFEGKERVVGEEEGRKFAEREGCAYREVCALSGDGVDEIFEDLANMAYMAYMGVL